MKTMKKSKIQSATRRMNGHSRGSRAKKSLMAFGTLAVIAAIGRMLRNRRMH
ncbi:MAG: hypothetical protein QOE54_2740 [Streptosporangiaceae bacterium]|jgi:hypothetical protein|nr:hypothetical protein [Streptosporangiaceae bacterium]MDX6430374.1 hypothetical protein [Streptosporangiaceae bacterium]